MSELLLRMIKWDGKLKIKEQLPGESLISIHIHTHVNDILGKEKKSKDRYWVEDDSWPLGKEGNRRICLFLIHFFQ